MSDAAQLPPEPKPLKKGKSAAAEAFLPNPVRRKRTAAVGAVLADVAGARLAKGGVLLAQLLPYWPSICPLLAAHAIPTAVRGGTLSITARSASVQREAQFLAPSILEGANTVLGYPALKDLRVVVGTLAEHSAAAGRAARLAAALPSAPKVDDKHRKLCQSVKDDALREALAALAATRKTS